MIERETYTVEIAGITRQLPLFEVAPGVRIAIFNMLGDTIVVKATAAALAERLKAVPADVLVTAEAKGIPLIYEMSALMGLPYIVLRKTYKSYMGDVISAETVSITTGKPQTLYLDEKDKLLILNKKVVLVDDVISTGSTLKGMEDVVVQAGGEIVKIAAVFTEGDADWSHIVALENLPVYTDCFTHPRAIAAPPTPMTTPTAASLSIFRYLFASVAEEMGVTLGRAAYSPNIKERLDFSCALFLGDGRMLAQAAHIPVHLGAMPASVQAAIDKCAPFSPGDVVIVNDPYQGGNHLPDITLVSPVFFGDQLSVSSSQYSVDSEQSDETITPSSDHLILPVFSSPVGPIMQMLAACRLARCRCLRRFTRKGSSSLPSSWWPPDSAMRQCGSSSCATCAPQTSETEIWPHSSRHTPLATSG